MSNVVKKVGGAIGVGPGRKKASNTVAMAEIATGTTVKKLADQIAPPPATPEQTAAQAGAAAARKRVGRRSVGQRGLMYASRLGGRTGQQDQRDTLGPA